MSTLVSNIYNTFNYGTGVVYGGTSSKSSYVIDPFTATVLDYNNVTLMWTTPTAPPGSILDFRIVRNQFGFSETEEDGYILPVSSYNLPSFSDNDSTIPLIPGRYVYYTFWLMLSDYSWNAIGYTYALIPKEHNTVSPELDPITKQNIVLQSSQSKFADLFPKVYTTGPAKPYVNSIDGKEYVAGGNSYLSEVDTSSDLYQFLGGIAFTLDEILTYADLVVPSVDGTTTNPNFVNSQSFQLGLPTEAQLGMQRQKRLVKEAFRIYPTKGTVNAVYDFAVSITNFYPVISTSPNILLSNQDSSFYKSVGNWLPSSLATITSDNTILGTVPNSALEPYATDTLYVGKIVTTGTNQTINNGTDNIKLKGIPIIAGTTYAFSYYAYSPSSTGTITPTVTFYDYTGTQLSAFTGTATATTSSWVKKTQTGLVAQGTNISVTSYDIGVTLANTATLTMPVGHGFVTGNKIIISGALSVASSTSNGYPNVSINGTYTVTAYTSTTVQFAFSGYGTVATQTVTTVTASLPKAVYATLTLTFSTAGTYYLDLLQFASIADSRYTTYYPARGVEIYLTPSKTNFLTNPSFENSTTSWSINGSPTITTPTSTFTKFSNTGNMLQLSTNTTVTTTSSPLLSTAAATGSFNSSQFVTFSIYAKVSTGTLSTMNLRLEATDTNTNGGTVFHNVPITLTTTWTRFQVNVYIPNNYAQSTTTVTAKLYGTSSSAVIQLDAGQLEQGYVATDYIDGSLSARGAVWTGTANASTSILYRNKATRLTSLLTNLPSQLPLNTPYIITTGPTTNKTLEFSGFSS